MTGTPLRWRSRRGLKELDVLFERYQARHLQSAGTNERAAYTRLLDCEDPQILQWIMQQAPVPEEFLHVISQLRRHD